MKSRYLVATEHGPVWDFRWPWQARRHYRTIKRARPGEAIMLAKVLAERTHPDELNPEPPVSRGRG